jgi:CubicO group peptidase (beta-lactamase class C family)
VSRYSVAATVTVIVALIMVALWRRRRGRTATAPSMAVDATWEPDDPAAAQLAGHLRPLVADGTVHSLAFAVITPGGPATGQVIRSGGQTLGPHVVLEIGSVTKVFTALLLADMAGRGEAGLDDPISRYLPAAVAQACPAAARITLRQLATHTAGLPRMPRNLLPVALRHPADPCGGYTTEHLYRALRTVRTAAPAAYRYSNYGFALLGQLLSNIAGLPYGELIADRITGPLGLVESGAGAPDGHTVAIGHRGRRPVRRWHLKALAGAGALTSTASDLARFLGANIHPETTPIPAAIKTIQHPHPSPDGSPVTGLGWHIAQQAGRPVLWHDGGTGGFSSMLALDRQAGCAIAAVATSSARADTLESVVLAALTELTGTGAQLTQTPTTSLS